VREQLPSAVGIFILPPSRAELERRLRARAQDSEATIQRRLANSRQEIAHALEFDYLIVNDEFERALEDMLAIVRSQRLQRQVQSHHLGALLAQLRA
jgi:guanylate kinase